MAGGAATTTRISAAVIAASMVELLPLLDARLTTVPVTGPWVGWAPATLGTPTDGPAVAPADGPVLGAAPAPAPAPARAAPECALPSTTVQSSGSPALSHGEGCGASVRTVSFPSLIVGLLQPF